MQKLENKECWWIAHNNSDVVHFGQMTFGQKVSTGQPTVEEFTVEQEWLDRLAELGVENPTPEMPEL